MDRRFHCTRRNLWLLTGMASIPVALLGLFVYSHETLVPILVLTLLVAIFDGWLVPFVLFNGVPTLVKKVLVIGTNLLFTTTWVLLTGGVHSVFFAHLYYLPILAVTIYGDFIDGIVTAVMVDVILLLMYFRQDPVLPLYRSDLAVELIIFLLLTIVIGYLLKSEEHFRRGKERLAEELQTAYDGLSSSHQQLKSYTRMIEDLNLQLEKLAVTDDLTALYNYRHFHSCLDRMISNQRKGWLSLLFADIDHFKGVNDAHGHGTGNEVLMQMAQVLQDNMRENDIVTRYGGEEFAVILPDTGVEGAIHVAERIRRAVEGHVFSGEDGNRLTITVSIGISTIPHDAVNKNELMSHADQALYQAKEQGRNSVCLYEAKYTSNAG